MPFNHLILCRLLPHPTWCEELTHLKRPWCWERLKAGGEGDDRVWDGWMASPTQWTWVSVISGSQWWTRRPHVLQSMWLQRDTTEQLNWTELERLCYYGDPFVICKESEGSKVFPCLQTNKLPCYRFTGTSRRPRLLGQCHRTLLATKAELPRWHSGKESSCQCRRCKRRGAFLSWKTPWSRKWQCAPVFLPREFHGLRSLVGYSPWGRKESDMTEDMTWVMERARMHTHTRPPGATVSAFTPLPRAPFPTEWFRGPDSSSSQYTQLVASQQRIWIRELKSHNGQQTPDLWSKGRYYPYYTRMKTNQLLAERGSSVPISSAVDCTNTLEKILQIQDNLCFCSRGVDSAGAFGELPFNKMSLFIPGNFSCSFHFVILTQPLQPSLG